MNIIIDRLAIGSYNDALHPPLEVTALLNVAAERDIKTALPYHKVPIVDMRPIPAHQMKEVVDWIQTHIGRYSILVVCNAGVGRSPSVVIGYLCCIKGYDYEEAVTFVAQRKPHIAVLPELKKTIEAVKGTFR